MCASFSLSPWERGRARGIFSLLPSGLLKNFVILSDAKHREGSPLEILRLRTAQNDGCGVFQQPGR